MPQISSMGGRKEGGGERGGGVMRGGGERGVNLNVKNYSLTVKLYFNFSIFIFTLTSKNFPKWSFLLFFGEFWTFLKTPRPATKHLSFLASEVFFKTRLSLDCLNCLTSLGLNTFTPFLI